MHQHRRRRRLTPAPHQFRRLGVTSLAAVVVAAVSTVIPAQAQTTITPTEDGDPPVVRDSSVAINVDRAAMHYSRSSATANFAQATASGVALTGCKGDNPAGTNASPRTTVTVTDPNGDTVLTMLSPVRDMGLTATGFLGNPPNQPMPTQPAPANANYRGDFAGNTYHGMHATLVLDGKPAGVYTVTTTDLNTVKTGLGACSFGTPVASGTGFGNTVTPGPHVTTETFEYRPWAVQFKDVLGNGSVRANLTPAEFQFVVGGTTSPIYAGGKQQQFYALPGGFALPSDPQACVSDPAGCLPAAATECVPAQGCTPRVMLVNRPGNSPDKHGLVGVFDLETKAFVAYATAGGRSRTLMSLGTANDAYYHDILAKLAAGSEAQGIDLASILATKVQVRSNGQQLSLSLLNGLQIDPTSSPNGVQIASDATVQAGVVLDIYSSLRLTGGACASNSANSSTAPERYTRKEDNGYTVTRSDLLPDVPKAGPLGALVGGPVYHVTGKFKSDALLNTATAVIGTDTAADEPNGYPVWVNPFLSGIHTAHPRTMDFLGTGTWSASESPILAGCLVVDFLLGTGVAVYNNPLPVGLGTIFDPLATPNANAEKLTDAVNQAVDQVVGTATANPTVSALLTQITALLPLS